MEPDCLDIKNIFKIPCEVPGYPAPTPPKGRKADIFDISQYTHIDQRAEQAPDDIAMTWTGLFDYLFKDLTTDLQKVRALFSWLGAQKFEESSYYTKDAPGGSPYDLLRQLALFRSLLNSYFAHLCRKAGLPCVVIRGYSKCLREYSVGDRNVSHFGCSWTAVYADGSWRLVDPQGAFVGAVCVGGSSSDYVEIEADGQAVRERNEDTGVVLAVKTKNERYFLPDPDMYIYTEFPSGDKAWQLLDKPWTLDKFLDMPRFWPQYFVSKWRLANKHKVIEEAPSGVCSITFDEVPEDTDFKYKLYFNEAKAKSKMPKERQLSSYIIKQNKKTVLTRLPVSGIYKLEISNEDGVLLCALRIDTTGEIKNQKSFPDTHCLGFNQEAVKAGLVDPSREDGLVIAREGEKICFTFRIRKPVQVRARLVHNSLGSQQLEGRVTQEQEDDLLTITVKVPYEAQNPEFSLQIDAREEESEEPFVNVVNYLLTHDKQLVFAEKGQEQQMQDELSAAIAGQDHHRLESAIKEYRHGGNKGSDILTKAYARLTQLHQNAIQEGLSSKKEEKLDTALNDADKSVASYMIHRTELYVQAQNALRRLRRLAGCRHEVKELSGRQVAEVQTYNHPHPGIVAAVEATFVLLGESTKKMKKWNYVQSLLRRHGRQSINYLIQNHDADNVEEDRVKRAATLLDTTNAEEVRSLSVGAAAFYTWSKAVVDAQADDEENAATSQQRQHEEAETESNKENTNNSSINNNNSSINYNMSDDNKNENEQRAE